MCQSDARRTEYFRKHGQIVDVSFVDVPQQRYSRDENQKINKGEAPEDRRPCTNCARKIAMCAGQKRTRITSAAKRATSKNSSVLMPSAMWRCMSNRDLKP